MGEHVALTGVGYAPRRFSLKDHDAALFRAMRSGAPWRRAGNKSDRPRLQTRDAQVRRVQSGSACIRAKGCP